MKNFTLNEYKILYEALSEYHFKLHKGQEFDYLTKQLIQKGIAPDTLLNEVDELVTKIVMYRNEVIEKE